MKLPAGEKKRVAGYFYLVRFELQFAVKIWPRSREGHTQVVSAKCLFQDTDCGKVLQLQVGRLKVRVSLTLKIELERRS